VEVCLGATDGWMRFSGYTDVPAALMLRRCSSRRYVTDLRINTVEVSFSVGWTWTGLIIFLAALIASFVTCCVGELVNEHHDHQY
jgi:hypothetical protein